MSGTKQQATWLHDRVMELIGRERLEEAEDQAAAFWEQAIDGIDQGQLKKALVRLFGKKDGEKLLREGRSEKVKRLARAEAYNLIARLEQKIGEVVEGPEDRLETAGLTLELHPYSEAKTLHEGVETFHRVDGLICFTGTITVHHEDGSRDVLSVFSRWVSHPFWQYSFAASKVAEDNQQATTPA